jgi:UDP-GlcNAc3NAcA epimerase
MSKPRLYSIVGARPNFIKLAALSPEIRKVADETIIHTGQHYDYNMNGIFFDGMNIPEPDYHLGVKADTHGKQAAQMISGIERILVKDRPDAVIVYGDTNSTLAGALAAAKLCIPVIHIEAGLRSWDKIPEEINRVVVDNISDMLFCPTWTAYRNAMMYVPSPERYNEGDVVVDLIGKYAPKRKQSDYYLLTIHRQENDDPVKLQSIFDGLLSVSEDIVFPCHPRIAKHLPHLCLPASLEVIDPVGYREMCEMEAGAIKIITDSGGVQKEAYLMEVPCVTLRDRTEWVETLVNRWNTLVGTDPSAIRKAIECPPESLPRWHQEIFGSPGVCKRVSEQIVEGLHG